MPPGRHAAPQGWYPDPVDHSRERYWDGWSWSRNTRESQHSEGYQQPQQQQLSGWQQRPDQRQGSYQQYGSYQDRPYQQTSYQPHPHAGYQHAAGQPGTVPLTADGVPIAGWGWRFLAGLLDLMIVSIVADIFSIPVFVRMIPAIRRYFEATVAAAQQGTVAPSLPTDLFSGADRTLITVISLAVGVLYFALFWRFKAATPAQMLCGLKIVPADHGTNTEPLPWPTAVVRALTWWVPISVSSVLLIFAVVNVLFPLGNAKRQAIHDLAARTQIVKIR